MATSNYTFISGLLKRLPPTARVALVIGAVCALLGGFWYLGTLVSGGGSPATKTASVSTTQTATLPNAPVIPDSSTKSAQKSGHWSGTTDSFSLRLPAQATEPIESTFGNGDEWRFGLPNTPTTHMFSAAVASEPLPSGMSLAVLASGYVGSGAKITKTVLGGKDGYLLRDSVAGTTTQTFLFAHGGKLYTAQLSGPSSAQSRALPSLGTLVRALQPR
jgi:hypothetical protein